MANPLHNIPDSNMDNTNIGALQRQQTFIQPMQTNASYSQQYYASPIQHAGFSQHQPRQMQRHPQQQFVHHNHAGSMNNVELYQPDPYPSADFEHYPQMQNAEPVYHDEIMQQQNIPQNVYMPNVRQGVQYPQIQNQMHHSTQQHNHPQIYQIFNEEIVQTTNEVPHNSSVNTYSQPMPYYEQTPQVHSTNSVRYATSYHNTPQNTLQQQSQHQMAERMNVVAPSVSRDFTRNTEDPQYRPFTVSQAEIFQSSAEQQYLPSVGSTCTIETTSPTPPIEENDVYNFSPTNDDNEIKLPSKAPSAFATGTAMPAIRQKLPTAEQNRLEIDTSQKKRNFSVAVPALEEEDDEDELSPNRNISPKTSKVAATASKGPTETETEQSPLTVRKRSRKQILPTTRKTVQIISTAPPPTAKIVATTTIKSSGPKTTPPANKLPTTKSSPIDKTSNVASTMRSISPKSPGNTSKCAQVAPKATDSKGTGLKSAKVSTSVTKPVQKNIVKTVEKSSPSQKKELKEDKKPIATKAKQDEAPRDMQKATNMPPASVRRPPPSSKEKEKEAAANSSILGNILAASNVPPKIQTNKRSVMLSDSFMDALFDQAPKKPKIVRKKLKKDSSPTDGASSSAVKKADNTPKVMTNAGRSAVAATAAAATATPSIDSITADNEARRRIRFADESGGDLVHVRFFEIEEGERMNVTKISPEEMKHQEIQNERMQGERRGLHFKPTHLPMPQGFEFRQSGSTTILRPWHLVSVAGLVELIVRGVNSESKFIEWNRQNTVMEAFHDPFVTLNMEDIDPADLQSGDSAPPPKIIPLDQVFAAHDSTMDDDKEAPNDGAKTPVAVTTASSLISQLPLPSTIVDETAPASASFFAEAISGAAKLSRLNAILPPNVAALVSGVSSTSTTPIAPQPVKADADELSVTYFSPADALPFEKKLLAEIANTSMEVDSPPIRPEQIASAVDDEDADDFESMDAEALKSASPEGPASPDGQDATSMDADMRGDSKKNHDEEDQEDTDIRCIPVERPPDAAEKPTAALNAFSDINAFMSKLRSSGIIDGANLAPSILDKVKSSISSTPLLNSELKKEDASRVEHAQQQSLSSSERTEWFAAPGSGKISPPVHPPIGGIGLPSHFGGLPMMRPLPPGFQQRMGKPPFFHSTQPNRPPYGGGRFPTFHRGGGGGFPSRFGPPRAPGGYGFYGDTAGSSGGFHSPAPMSFFPRQTPTTSTPITNITTADPPQSITSPTVAATAASQMIAAAAQPTTSGAAPFDHNSMITTVTEATTTTNVDAPNEMSDNKNSSEDNKNNKVGGSVFGTIDTGGGGAPVIPLLPINAQKLPTGFNSQPACTVKGGQLTTVSLSNASVSVSLPHHQPSFHRHLVDSEPDVRPPGLGGSPQPPLFPPPNQQQNFNSSIGPYDSLENCDVEALMPVAKTFVKQCTYYIAGGCNYGDACHFAHGNVMTAGLRHAISAVNAGHRPFSSAAGYCGFRQLNYDERTKKLKTVQVPPSHVTVSDVGNEQLGGYLPKYGGGGRGRRRFMSPVRRGGGFESRRFGGGRRGRSRSISPVRTSSRRSRSRSPLTSSSSRRSRSRRISDRRNRSRSNSSTSSRSSASKEEKSSNKEAKETGEKDKEVKSRDAVSSAHRTRRSRRSTSRSPSPGAKRNRRNDHRRRGRSRSVSNTYSDIDEDNKSSSRRRGRGDNRHGDRDLATKRPETTTAAGEDVQPPADSATSFGCWADSPSGVKSDRTTQRTTKESSEPVDGDLLETFIEIRSHIESLDEN